MTWIIIRSSGFVAYLLLAGASIWGLLVATKLLGRSVAAKNLTYVHESLSIGAILATLVHVGALIADNFIEFTIADVLVPGSAGWRPTAVALGIAAMYGLALVTASFYVRRQIGQRSWRRLHYVSFGIFAAAVAHGVSAGTDTTTPWGMAIYAASITAVLGLVAYRVFTAGREPSASRRTHLRQRHHDLRSPEGRHAGGDGAADRFGGAAHHVEPETGRPASAPAPLQRIVDREPRPSVLDPERHPLSVGGGDGEPVPGAVLGVGKDVSE